MRARSFAGLLLVACSGSAGPGHFQGTQFVMPTTFAEGSADPKSTEASPSASAARPKAPQVEPPKGSQPDPEPLRQAEQWEYELEWNAGAIEVVSAAPKRFKTPVVTARRMGRFALELWIGAELVDRVRFDFPMLAVEETKHGNSARPQPPSLEKGVHSRQRVLVPAAARARRAVIVDRSTEKALELPWPPQPIAAK